MLKVVLIGSGNVATHLGAALHAAGHQIVQVWSRTPANAVELAARLDAQGVASFEELTGSADLYVLSVPDQVIHELAPQFSFKDRLLVHTSGTTDIRVLDGASSLTGVFYPLQTFSKQKEIDFSQVPVAVEGSSAEVTDMLLSVASGISGKALLLDSEQRRILHTAAVIACNFSNHLYALAALLLEDNRMDFDLLKPLIAETASKVQFFQPAEVQTGPAVRNDRETIEAHLEYLSKYPGTRELYEALTGSIISMYRK